MRSRFSMSISSILSPSTRLVPILEVLGDLLLGGAVLTVHEREGANRLHPLPAEHRLHLLRVREDDQVLLAPVRSDAREDALVVALAAAVLDVDLIEVAFDVVLELDHLGLGQVLELEAEVPVGARERSLQVLLRARRCAPAPRHRNLLWLGRSAGPGRRWGAAGDGEAQDRKRREVLLPVVLELRDLGLLAGLRRGLAPLPARELDREPVLVIHVGGAGRCGRQARKEEQRGGRPEYRSSAHQDLMR